MHSATIQKNYQHNKDLMDELNKETDPVERETDVRRTNDFSKRSKGEKLWRQKIKNKCLVDMF